MLYFLKLCLNFYIKLRRFLISDGFFGMAKMGNILFGTMIASGILGQLHNQVVNTILFLIIYFVFFLLIFIFALDGKWKLGKYKGLTTIEIIKSFSTYSYLVTMLNVVIVRLSFIVLGSISLFVNFLQNNGIYISVLTNINLYLIIYLMFIFYTLLYFTYHITRNTVDLEEIDLLLKLYIIIISCISCIIILTNVINATFVITSATTCSTISYIISKKKIDDKKLLSVNK